MDVTKPYEFIGFGYGLREVASDKDNNLFTEWWVSIHKGFVTVGASSAKLFGRHAGGCSLQIDGMSHPTLFTKMDTSPEWQYVLRSR